MSDQVFEIVKSVDAPLEHRATVYFLHGFLGDKNSTWQSDAKVQGTFWPYWLGQVFPHLKVVSIGYKTPPVSDQMSVEDKANLLLKDLRDRTEETKKPFVFICHSMGGVLAKRMLLMADGTADADIFKNLRCLFFFATPHRGSNVAERLNHLLPGIFIRNQVLRDLALNGSYLKFLNRSYCDLLKTKDASHIHHYDFCETKRVYKLLRVVDDQSSRLFNDEIAGMYEISPLGYNHIAICKFEHTEKEKDRRFESIIALLDRVFSDTNALEDRRDWHFSKQPPRPDTGFLHHVVCLLATFLSLVSIPLAIVVGGTMQNLGPHPVWSFVIEQPSFAWISAGFAMLVAIVITYACKEKSIVWHVIAGVLTSITLVGLIMFISSGKLT